MKTTFKNWLTENLEIHKDKWGVEIIGTVDEVLQELKGNKFKYHPNMKCTASIEFNDTQKQNEKSVKIESVNVGVYWWGWEIIGLLDHFIQEITQNPKKYKGDMKCIIDLEYIKK